jgi:ferrous iron transport protein A
MFKGFFQKAKRGDVMAICPAHEDCGECPALREKACTVENRVSLSSYKPGEKGTIFQICGEPDFRRRLMEMGFVRGTEVSVVKYAPLNDPVEFVIKGCHITLRKAQAEDILMDAPGRAA